jgi:hypothetical protein
MASCALSQGYNLDCRNSVGGVKEVYLIEASNITGVTAASGVVSAITKSVGTRFWLYQQDKQSTTAEEQVEASEENGTLFYTQTLKLILNKMQTSIRNEILVLGQQRLVAVVVDRNGNGWLYGKDNFLTLQSGSKASTGKAMGDRNGYEIDFKGFEPQLALNVPSSIITTLQTPG